MTLEKTIATMRPALRENAEDLLGSEDLLSLTGVENNYEAEFFYSDDDAGGHDEDTFITEVYLEDNNDVWQYWCQCGNTRGICVHVAAVLLGIVKMKQAGCEDYHDIEKLQDW